MPPISPELIESHRGRASPVKDTQRAALDAIFGKTPAGAQKGAAGLSNSRSERSLQFSPGRAEMPLEHYRSSSNKDPHGAINPAMRVLGKEQSQSILSPISNEARIERIIGIYG